MPDVKGLKQERANLATEIRSMADSLGDDKPDFVGEDKAKWEQINKRYDELGSKIDIAERAEQIDKEAAEIAEAEERAIGRGDISHKPGKANFVPSQEHRAQALHGWCCRQAGINPTKEQQEAAQLIGLDLGSQVIEIPLMRTQDYERWLREERELGQSRLEQRDQLVGTTTLGGHTVPTRTMAAVEKTLLHFGAVRQVAKILRTASGEAITWPTVDDTGQTGALVTEAGAATEQDITFGAQTFNAYKYSSKFVQVSYELLRDSLADIPTLVGELLGERLGRITNTAFTTGTGSSQPNGIVTVSSLGKTTAASGAIDDEEILDLIHSCDIAYRSNASFMMHDNILLAVRKLKDSQGGYYWQPSFNGPLQDRLFGYPYVVNNDMASTIATTNKTMLFGDFSRFMIRDAGPIRMRRLDELYAINDLVAFLGWMSTDCDKTTSSTKAIMHMVQV